jgi:DNA-binding MarR family transcriptional regulator
MDETIARLAAAGYDDLRPVHRPIIRDLLLDGQRPTELAAHLGLSKQAINDILREFEANGYITLEPDPTDGRAKRIVVTDRGWKLATTASRLSRDVGRRWAAQVGEERYAAFEAVLREITTAGNANGQP